MWLDCALRECKTKNRAAKTVLFSQKEIVAAQTLSHDEVKEHEEKMVRRKNKIRDSHQRDESFLRNIGINESCNSADLSR